MKLSEPYFLADIHLSNRIVMAPMTRARNGDTIANEQTALYYAQRATAGLIVSEGTTISPEGQGYLFVPGIWSDEQVAGWSKVTQAVHGKGSKIFAQLWHVGRMSHKSIQAGGRPPVSASAGPGYAPPHVHSVRIPRGRDTRPGRPHAAARAVRCGSEQDRNGFRSCCAERASSRFRRSRIARSDRLPS